MKPCKPLLILIAKYERLAISTLDHSRIGFVSTYTNAVKSAVVTLAGMVSALLYGTFDVVVGVVLVHFLHPFNIPSLIKCGNYEIIRFHIYYARPYSLYTSLRYTSIKRVFHFGVLFPQTSHKRGVHPAF